MIEFMKKQKKNYANNKISKEITKQIGKIAIQISKGQRNEEETRRWCIELLLNAFGYKSSDIETETKALGQRVDISLMDKGNILAIIECKAATVKLGMPAIMQAANYATSLGVEWAVTTNGHHWMMFHVSPALGKEPDVVMIFDVEILDEDGLSKNDAACLYLLTKQAITTGETKKVFHTENIMTIESLKRSMISPAVIAKIKEELQEQYHRIHGITPEVDADSLRDAIEAMADAFE